MQTRRPHTQLLYKYTKISKHFVNAKICNYICIFIFILFWMFQYSCNDARRPVAVNSTPKKWTGDQKIVIKNKNLFASWALGSIGDDIKGKGRCLVCPAMYWAWFIAGRFTIGSSPQLTAHCNRGPFVFAKKTKKENQGTF